MHILQIIALALVARLVRLILSLRYKIRVSGLDSLFERKKARGILFLPNHPAEIDPIILMTLLGPTFGARPLIVEHFYHLRGAHFLMKMTRAIPIPNIDGMVNSWKAKQIEEVFLEIAAGLKRGENFLIYPAGKLKLEASEEIGGASFVHRLLESAKDAEVVLVRTSGLWGSRFSRALTGKVPNFGKMVLEGLKIAMKNGFFFMPRRSVQVEFCRAPADFPRGASRLELNRYLEAWYNQRGPEPLIRTSYFFWKKQPPPLASKKKEAKTFAASPKIEGEIFAFLAKLSKMSSSAIRKEMQLSHDLGLDSLDVAQVYVFLSEKYEIEHLSPGELQSVEDVIIAASLGFRKEEQEDTEGAAFAWPTEKQRPHPFIPMGSTIQEAFLKAAERMRGYVACVDATTGILSYRKFKLAALTLALSFKKLPGSHVGVLLPASSGCYVVIFALLLARKIPVILNWTAGARSLNHAVDLLKLSAVLSVRRFLDKIQNIDLGVVGERFLFLEDLRDELSWKDKVRALLMSGLPAERLMRALQLHELKASDTAVVLFTSGTESLPKAVPLTHGNLLSNQRGALSCIPLTRGDILYCVLPPFHSFGFSATGIMPILAGMRSCYAPDPTDAQGLSRDIARWKPTVFCCAPSFIQALFKVASAAQLSSLRLIVSGAEKASKALFEEIGRKVPHAKVLEGYGITECSPIVTLQRLNEERRGVGRALPGISLRCIDPASRRELPSGKEGEICIEGPGVFLGYLGSHASPFIAMEGRQWYRSGDLGYLDEAENLILSGRIKRFVKIGAEMISLGAIEEELARLSLERGWNLKKEEGPSLALSVRGVEGDKPQLILFTTFEVSLETVNEALKEAGFSRLVKIAEVRRIEQIPLTGTGKTHYRLLDEIRL